MAFNNLMKRLFSQHLHKRVISIGTSYFATNELEENMEKLDMNKSYINRELNVGFSGGEKKKNEIPQMLTLNPKLAILDETDSGLDVDAINIVSKGIKLFKNDDNAVLIITHNTKLIKDLDIDYVHILKDGSIQHTGDINLAFDVEKNGYSSINNRSGDDSFE